jgi:hypothetical protein
MGLSLSAQLTLLYCMHCTPPKPALHPPYCTSDIPHAYAQFCADIAGKDFEDPRHILVSVVRENFPKLLGAKLRGTEKKAKAAKVLNALENGTFNPGLYDIDSDRLETLFWIEDTICQCHSIHDNCRTTIEADEIYVKTYEKIGSPAKLVFTRQLPAGQIIVVTSFLTDVRDIAKFACMPPKWP